jgi:hypothetical protein
MFSFGLAKLIFLVGILLVVIYGSRLLRHVQASREAEDRRRGAESRPKPAARQKARDAEPQQPEADVQDMVKCRVCGAYVASLGAQDCGQVGCPFARRV